jgi:hypothetical protein
MDSIYQQYKQMFLLKMVFLPLHQPLLYSFWMKILWEIPLMMLILQLIWSQ